MSELESLSQLPDLDKVGSAPVLALKKSKTITQQSCFKGSIGHKNRKFDRKDAKQNQLLKKFQKNFVKEFIE